ncbi:MAG: restriction endonuclease subunit S [Clostridiales bacterium]|nr:restriction endonuclease subunit S [Clostridiales bacterium]
MKSFSDIFIDCTSAGTKIPKESYLDKGTHIIIDQGQNEIAGYTNEETGLYTDVPAIIFGDHTRAIKYVEEPFFLGADGVKLLKCKDKDANYKYLYYALKSAKIPDTGYNRHFKWLKEIEISYPDQSVQSKVVKTLDSLSTVIDQRKDELIKLDDLIKARFVEIFGDPRSNPFGYEKKPLGNTCKVVTGNTPSRKVPEYYGDYIEWIKTDNIVSGLLHPTKASEYLSEQGALEGRTVDENAVLMACIAGSVASIGRVCVTDRRVAFNQQINAVVPEQYNILFLYILLQISKDYLVEDINMALKGILSKSKLEEKVFFVPPMKYQNDFAEFVRQVDKSKFDCEKLP